jgi:hypothetical protein
VSVSRSEPWANRVRTALTDFRQWPLPPSPCPQLCYPPYSPPSATASCGYKGSAPPMSPPYSTFIFCSCPTSVFSSCYADTNRRTPVHQAQTPPATPLPNRRLLELHPAPVHICDPSSSGPDNPYGPSPLLLPARRAPSPTARSSLSSTNLTTPRAPRRRVRPPRTTSCRPPPSDATTHRRSPLTKLHLLLPRTSMMSAHAIPPPASSPPS